MTTLRFDLEVTLPRATAFDLLDQHYRDLGYRVEQSDRMNFRLVMNRGWVLGALFGGRIRHRSVWMRATVEALDENRALIRIAYEGYRKAMDTRCRDRWAEEVRAFEETCRRHPPRRVGGGPDAPAVLREVIIKEVVRIPCPYCGNLVENTAKKCDECGAPVR